MTQFRETAAAAPVVPAAGVAPKQP
jgi:hypothetical protein